MIDINVDVETVIGCNVLARGYFLDDRQRHE
jgi:hypothetical protein